MHIKRTGEYLKRLVRSLRHDIDLPMLRPLPNPFRALLKALHLFNEGKWEEKEILCTSGNYNRSLERIRDKYSRAQRIKVMIIATYAAKWKVQSLYNALESDPMFKPLVGISCMYRYDGKTPRELFEDAVKLRIYLEEKGCRCQYICDPLKAKFFEIDPGIDVVVYTESWYTVRKHHPITVSNHALTFYIPYFVPNYVDARLDCGATIHRCYWRYVVLNEGIANLYRATLTGKPKAGEFVALGHPMLDGLHLSKRCLTSEKRKKVVIYAPHWTFEHPRHAALIAISTFTKSGKPILDYAKSHKEFHWIFKPHPHLRQDLIDTGMMSKEEVSAYYDAWRQLGQVYEGGDYLSLFKESCAMITDCGSFLTEYGASGNPIIHLISPRNNMVPPPILADVYNTYYKVHNLEEMYAQFKLVLEDGQDPMKEQRLAALERASLCNVYSAGEILKYMKECFKGRVDERTAAKERNSI